MRAGRPLGRVPGPSRVIPAPAGSSRRWALAPSAARGAGRQAPRPGKLLGASPRRELWDACGRSCSPRCAVSGAHREGRAGAPRAVTGPRAVVLRCTGRRTRRENRRSPAQWARCPLPVARAAARTGAARLSDASAGRGARACECGCEAQASRTCARAAACNF